MPEVTVSAPTTVEVNRLLLQSLVETAKEIKTHVQDLAFNTNAHHAQQSVQQNAMRATIESTHTNLQGIAHTSSATHDEIQQTNRNLLPAIVNGLGDLDLHITNPIPRLFFVAKVDETKHPSSLLEKPRHLLQGTIAQRYHLYFVCAHSRLPVDAPISIYLTKPWADAAAPYLSAGLHVLQGALSVLGYQVNWAGLAFHLSEDAVREMLLEVAAIVKTKGL
jgi:hypothetical protein